MLGDICTMSGLAMAFGGLAVAAFDRDERRAPTPTLGRARCRGSLMAAVGLFVGLREPRRAARPRRAAPRRRARRGRVSRAARRRAKPRLRSATPWAPCVARRRASSCAVDGGARHRGRRRHARTSTCGSARCCQVAVQVPDVRLLHRAIGHALAPWSAFLPFALGRLLLRRRAGARPAPARASARASRAWRSLVGRRGGARRARVPRRRAPTSSRSRRRRSARSRAPSPSATSSAARSASIAVGLGTLLLAAVLHHDFHELPEKAYQAFGVSGAHVPRELQGHGARRSGRSCSAASPLCAFLTWVERDAERDAVRSRRATRRSCARCARPATACSRSSTSRSSPARRSRGSSSSSGMRTHAHWLPQISSTIRDVVLNAWWVDRVRPARRHLRAPLRVRRLAVGVRPLASRCRRPR